MNRKDPTQLEFSFMAEALTAREPDTGKAQQQTKLIEALKLLRQHPRFVAFMEGD